MGVDFNSSRNVGRIGSSQVYRTSGSRKHCKAEFENLLFVFRDNNYESLEYRKCFVGTEKIVWHYTTGEELLNIWDTEVLAPPSADFAGEVAPALWFSSDQDWQPITDMFRLGSKGAALSFSKAEAARVSCGLVRLGLPEAALHTWEKVARKAGFDDSQIQAVKTRAWAEGTSPDGWMGCLQAVSIWDLMIEVWDGQSWECLQDPSTSEARIWTAFMKAAA